MKNLTMCFELPGERKHYENAQIEAQAINAVLIEHGVVIDSIIEGVRVIQYRATLSPRVNVNRLLKLESNLKIALNTNTLDITVDGNQLIIQKEGAANTVRIAEFYREDFLRAKGIQLALGVDMSGNHIYTDLAKQPHMLVAGTTGSGKSMFLHQVILSILFKYECTQIYAIDTKNVEFNHYRNIPNFTLINDAQNAARFLESLVDNMNKRYVTFAQHGYRDIDDARDNGFAINPIVVVIDEFADLIMNKAFTKAIETNIVKIAQKSRAAGIHLVIATQRPTSDVITGLIKANIPCRVCMKVKSAMESRIVMDKKGGENLLGYGDLYYTGNGMFEPIRLQASYISTNEMRTIGAMLSVPNKVTSSFEKPIQPQRNTSISYSIADKVINSFIDFIKK